MRKKEAKFVVIIMWIGLVLVAAQYVGIGDFGGPIAPFYEPEPTDPVIVDNSQDSDRYQIMPHISYMGNDTDQFPKGEGLVWTARADILRRDPDSGGYGFSEAIMNVSGGLAVVYDEAKTSVGTYAPDTCDDLLIMFYLTIEDSDGNNLWTWMPTLFTKDASVRWHDSGTFVKSYNYIDDDGWSMSVWLMEPVYQGGIVYNPDPIQDADIKAQQQFQLTILFLAIGSSVVGYIFLRSKPMSAYQRQRTQQPLVPTKPKQFRHPTIPEEKEPEPTEEELEEMEMERIRKDARITLLEELIQSLEAIKNPTRIMEHADMSLPDFEPEDKSEEQLYDIAWSLYEEVKEKLRHEAIEADR